jgi:hypothetical protein
MVKGVFTVGIAAALSAAMSLLTPVEVSARGLGWHNSHTGSPIYFRSEVRHHHRDYGQYQNNGVVADYSLGSYIPNNYLQPESELSLPLQVDAVAASSLALTCSHSRETVTVQSEGGGTREITITRC